ncbi:cocaine- and amphetamine-regulated transcript protein-like isoform X2 [Pogoniulus pusillus]|uniref:cocaine- and amphetamine-regulated transcript protein-like isoform X2 n=1 Tax=Pogoniulus pusillus TaxID=488313 RepID=UPI0030B9508E
MPSARDVPLCLVQPSGGVRVWGGHTLVLPSCVSRRSARIGHQYKASRARWASGSCQGLSPPGSMASAWLCLLCLASAGRVLPGTVELALGLAPAQSLPGNNREEVELVEALQEVLEKLGGRELPVVEKRLSWVPMCQPGEPCAVRRGARFGKLCSCPRGTTCNFFILKCS